MTLSARVEQAGEGSFVLDCEIHRTLYEGTDPRAKFMPKPFTVSIDAALRLVPEGIYPTIDFTTDRVWLRTGNGFDLPSGCAYGFAATVPLSICAAALKARGL